MTGLTAGDSGPEADFKANLKAACAEEGLTDVTSEVQTW